MDYIRAKVAVSVPYEEGRHVPEPGGAVIPVADVVPYMRKNLLAGDPWLDTLFEPATEADYEAYTGFVAKLAEVTEEPEAVVEEESEEEHPMKKQQRRKAKTDEATEA